eukprot:GHVL01008788.1.p1 GENE.GHVL01008788.1~~GHVL01008788.1.p1  ORF type:complete len:206 (+),score=14.15 GHVL01008788.1:235-852(+)
MMQQRKCYAVLTLLLLAVTYSNSEKDSDDWRFKRSDDTVLQTTVERQAVLLQNLQAEVSALKTRQHIISTQVAFFVRFKADPSSTDGTHLTTLSTLKFDNVITNIGNGYDHVTGIFTAPVTGVYAFFLSAMSANQQASIFLSINKHGVILDEVFAEGGSDNYDQGSTQVTAHLSVGEQVWVRQEGGTVVRGGYWTVFNGYLLQAD